MLMKTVTARPDPAAFYAALLMASPPPRSHRSAHSPSPTPTPPTSLPPSPTPLVTPVSSAQNPNNNNNNSATRSDPLFAFADDDFDDGIDLVTQMLDAAKSSPTPLLEPNIDRLVADINASSWGCKEGVAAMRRSSRSSRSSPVKSRSPAASLDRPQQSRRAEWCYEEDCAVADVFTSACPEQQCRQLASRLPHRTWSEACVRFRVLCGAVVEEDFVPRSKPRSHFWEAQRRLQRRLKPKCLIAKTLAKLR